MSEEDSLCTVFPEVLISRANGVRRPLRLGSDSVTLLLAIAGQKQHIAQLNPLPQSC